MGSGVVCERSSYIYLLLCLKAIVLDLKRASKSVW